MENVKKLKLFLFGFLIVATPKVIAQTNSGLNSVKKNTLQSAEYETVKVEWKKLIEDSKLNRQSERKLGWSYIISGGIGLAGGLLGQDTTSDLLEKGIYTIFQSMGIASIGVGMYKLNVENEEQTFIKTLNFSDLSDHQKWNLYEKFKKNKKDQLIKENRIRGVTHGLIAILNLYNASQLNQGPIKDSLQFVGGVNLLACVSYSFDF